MSKGLNSSGEDRWRKRGRGDLTWTGPARRSDEDGQRARTVPATSEWVVGRHEVASTGKENIETGPYSLAGGTAGGKKNR